MTPGAPGPDRYLASAGLPPRQSSRVGRLWRAASAQPGVTCGSYGLGHARFIVGRKTFAYILNNHHHDGHLCLCVKSTMPRQRELTRADPDAYRVPAYLGHQGWVSIRLDRAKFDRVAAAGLLAEAYALQAPRRKVARGV
ncbi:MAG: MmcQ/YjbR family DNA-binding protein [Phycisphaerae bacterium]|nr:MmcQ/YjbR family DNA-binding protein [Phycisphaerae bacterium]